MNEYNIVEKIKAANKELFDESQQVKMDSPDDSSSSSTTNNTRKVTFAENLENYEPCGSVEDAETTNDEDTLHAKLAANFHFPAIDEEDPPNDNDLEENPNDPDDDNDSQAIAEQERQLAELLLEDELYSAEIVNKDLIDEVVEEICEEIDGMEVNTECSNEEAETERNSRRMIVKQATFDFEETEAEEEDNKSMSNFLLSECECEDDDLQLATEEEISKRELAHNETNDLPAEDEDEDDDLSIIVASYIQENDYDNSSFLSDQAQNNCRTTSIRSFSGHRKNRSLSVNKRFSFRRKKTTGNTNTNTTANSNAGAPSELTDLKFNYKTCCEYKHSEQEKLPKYTGYLSEYGLSREQLERREAQLQRKQNQALQKALASSEKEMQKMQDNERAFTKWLKNKMRFPINKTKNMFDVKIVRGGRKRLTSGSTQK